MLLNKNACLVNIILFALLFFTTNLNANVMSGSKTEQKINKKVEQLLKSARRHAEANRHQQAIEKYWEILEINPNELNAYFELAELFYKLRVYKRTIELLSAALKYAENSVEKNTLCHYYCLLTQAHMHSEQSGEASKTLFKAIEIAPKNPLPRKILGDIYSSRNRFNNAFRAYSYALQLEPSYLPALEKLAELAIEHKNETAAQLALKLMTEHYPHSASEYRARIIEANISLSQPAVQKQPKKHKTTVQRPIQNASTSKQTEADIISMPALSTELSNQHDYSQDTQHTSTPLPTDDIEQTATTLSKTTKEQVIQATPEEIENNTYKLWSGDEATQKTATDFLIKSGIDGLHGVEELLYDGNPAVRMIAINTLFLFKNYPKEVMEILEDSLDEPDPGVRKQIFDYLEVMKKNQ